MSKTRLDELLHELRTPTPPLPEYDQDKVDAAVLALLSLTLHQPGPYSAWKGFDWAVLNRLHVKGLIADPKNKHKSVALTALILSSATYSFSLHGSPGNGKTRIIRTFSLNSMLLLGQRMCRYRWQML